MQERVINYVKGGGRPKRTSFKFHHEETVHVLGESTFSRMRRVEARLQGVNKGMGRNLGTVCVSYTLRDL